MKKSIGKLLAMSAVFGDLMPNNHFDMGSGFAPSRRPTRTTYKPAYDTPTMKAIKRRRKANKVARKSRQINRA